MLRKNIIFAIVSIAFCIQAIAQNSSASMRFVKLRLDTINIHGLLTSPEGKPIPYAYISSKAPSIEYYNQKAYSWTDSNGKFSLKGALFNDTLTFSSLGYSISVLNNGSRFMHVKISLPKHENKEEGKITAKRIKRPSKPKVFSVIDANSFSCGFLAVYSDYPGGKENLYKLLTSKITYPPLAVANNREGKVTIEFDVQRDGTLSNFSITNGIGMGCEEAVINALKKGARWHPAIDNGRPVITRQSVSFIFKLTG